MRFWVLFWSRADPQTLIFGISPTVDIRLHSIRTESSRHKNSSHLQQGQWPPLILTLTPLPPSPLHLHYINVSFSHRRSFFWNIAISVSTATLDNRGKTFCTTGQIRTPTLNSVLIFTLYSYFCSVLWSSFSIVVVFHPQTSASSLYV